MMGKKLRTRAAMIIVALALFTLMPTAGATPSGGLSVTTTHGRIRFHTGLDTAGISGTFAFTGTSTASCGADAWFTLGTGVWKATGRNFHARKALCIWRNPGGRLRSVVLNYHTGRWTVSLNAAMGELANPVLVGLRIGSSFGSQSVQMTPTRNGWRFP